MQFPARFGLGGFVAPGQQNYYFQATLREIDAVAWPVMNPHFRNPIAHRLAIAEVSVLGAVDTRLNAARCLLILQPGEPGIEHYGGVNAFHEMNCIVWDTYCQLRQLPGGHYAVE